jgi:hypothetical protein
MATGRAGWAPIPRILNQPLTVNGQTLTVVGVAPKGFRSTTLGLDPEIFVPITMRGLSPGREPAPSTIAVPIGRTSSRG